MCVVQMQAAAACLYSGVSLNRITAVLSQATWWSTLLALAEAVLHGRKGTAGKTIAAR